MTSCSDGVWERRVTMETGDCLGTGESLGIRECEGNGGVLERGFALALVVLP
jgi:hypothetical protein